MADNDLSPLAADLLSGVTDSMVSESSAFREEGTPTEGPPSGLEATTPPRDWRDAISTTAYDFVVRWETGGKAYYEGVIKGRPIWPGFASGITIGCGYDLGYHTPEGIQSEWMDRIPKADLKRLAKASGFRTVEPNRAAKVAQAKELVSALSDIIVTWPVAIEQFDKAKMPKLVGQLFSALDNLDSLHPHSKGALLSLVFNRGNSFTASGPRFSEMRAIREIMQEGNLSDYAKIPGLLLSMRRIWGLDSSLAKRREGEAKLFQAGLDEANISERVAIFLAGEQKGASHNGEEASAGPLFERHEDVEGPATDEEDVDELEAALASGAAGPEAPGLGPATVRWNPKDDEQPDYRHLDTRLSGATAELTAADFRALLAGNAFEPLPGKIIIALRGARLVNGSKRERVGSFTIVDQRPDHRDFKCVIGVFDPSSDELWAYQASTVPNAFYVHKCFADSQAGKPIASLTGNILPTGCYTLTVGTHKRGQRGEIPTVLRLSATSTGASQVVVLRSIADTMYDRFDKFPTATPADNVHPAQMNQGFSSAGCLTIPGFFREGAHSGLWSDFRKAAGITPESDGHRFSLVLLTGLDAVIAADGRARGISEDERLVRLRHGSRGELVARLQTQLGLQSDASQLIGPVTRAALIKRQVSRLGYADGIHSPSMDHLLGLDVFGET